MYSDKDFQTFWFRYKTEGEPHGISSNSFCVNQGVLRRNKITHLLIEMELNIMEIHGNLFVNAVQFILDLFPIGFNLHTPNTFQILLAPPCLLELDLLDWVETTSRLLFCN